MHLVACSMRRYCARKVEAARFRNLPGSFIGTFFDTDSALVALQLDDSNSWALPGHGGGVNLGHT